ncbi:MAG: sigma-70 family RNA polymerase sigma factor [Pseudomonadota bacterium]
MNAIAQGDRAAMTALIARHMQPVYRYAYHLTNNPSSAEDLTQDTWLKVWQKAGAYRADSASVSTWLHRILHNQFVDSTRKSWRERFFGLPDQDTEEIDWFADNQAQGQPGHLEKLEKDEAATHMDYALRKLPVNQRSALLLQVNNGISNQEIAHILGLGVRAVESLQSRARKNLRRILEHKT